MAPAPAGSMLSVTIAVLLQWLSPSCLLQLMKQLLDIDG
jgi:hypothetical protein